MAEGLPAVCLDARHSQAVLSARPNKSDRNDARGLAEMVRADWFRAVTLKSTTSHERKSLLIARHQLVETRVRIDNPKRFSRARCRSLSRSDTQTLPIRRTGFGRPHLQVRRRVCQDQPLRSRHRVADQGGSLTAEGMGRSAHEEIRGSEGKGCGRPQAGRASGPDVGRRNRVPVDEGARDGLTGRFTIELRASGGAVLAGTAGRDDRASCVVRRHQPSLDRAHLTLRRRHFLNP